MFDQVEAAHLLVGDLDSGIVVFGNQIGADSEAGSSLGRADEVEHGVHVGERLAGPVPADLAEQAVLDGVPLGGARRIVAHGDDEAQGIANPILQGLFPGAATGAVASARIGQDENLVRLRIAQTSLVAPPLSNRIDGEVRRVMADAHEHRPAVGLEIVDAARGSQRFGLGAKIVIFDGLRLAVPLGAGIFEVAGQFFLFAADADDGQALSCKALALLADA